MIRYVLVLQAVFFFAVGTQVVRHQISIARMEALASIYVTMPMQALTEIRV